MSLQVVTISLLLFYASNAVAQSTPFYASNTTGSTSTKSVPSSTTTTPITSFTTASTTLFTTMKPTTTTTSWPTTSTTWSSSTSTSKSSSSTTSSTTEPPTTSSTTKPSTTWPQSTSTSATTERPTPSSSSSSMSPSTAATWPTYSPGPTGVPRADFFPYGHQNGDESLRPGNLDDGTSNVIPLTTNFPFFNDSFNALWLNINGAISFQSPISTYTPICEPVPLRYSMIAPYWCDIDLRYGGYLWYRQSTDESVLQKAKEEVSNAFPEDFPNVDITWAFISTWQDVSFFGAGGCNYFPRNTFQSVIVTNGEHSFAIFYYNEITWTTGKATDGNCSGLGGTEAKAGFDAGDGHSLYKISGSCTPNIIRIEQHSNVNSPGKWVFRVDLEHIIPAGTTTPSTPATSSPWTSPPVAHEPRRCANSSTYRIWLDIVIVIDSSNSMTPNGFFEAKAMLEFVIGQLTISQTIAQSSRVGIVYFASEAKQWAALTAYQSTADALAGINSIPYVGNSQVNIQGGLQMASDLMSASDKRPNVQNVIILVMSANTIGPFKDPHPIAQQLKNEQVTLVTVAFHQSSESEPPPSDLASYNYNFTSGDNDLTANIQNAFFSTNCFCPANWKQFKDRQAARYGECVYPGDFATSWTFAKQACQNIDRNAFLADELSAEKHVFLKNLALTLWKQNTYWIGLNDRQSLGVYNWDTTNSSYITYWQQVDFSNWASGYPNDNKGHRCVANGRVTGFQVEWTKEDCGFGKALKYFCQKHTCDTDNYCQ